MPDQIHSYVDEAGDPALFGCERGSGVIVGNDGCSKFFSMGKLEVVDPECLSQKLTALRHELLTDPYFAKVESFKPERPKTAHGFYANNDLPEVRYQGFKRFREIAPNLRSHVVAPGKKDLHGDFGAYCYIGFRHSFCHGWAGGPTAWLSKNVLGVTPVAPGFAQVRISPNLGHLAWAEGTYPTPKGAIHVRHDKQADGSIKSVIKLPDGVTQVK